MLVSYVVTDDKSLITLVVLLADVIAMQWVVYVQPLESAVADVISHCWQMDLPTIFVLCLFQWLMLLPSVSVVDVKPLTDA